MEMQDCCYGIDVDWSFPPLAAFTPPCSSWPAPSSSPLVVRSVRYDHIYIDRSGGFLRNRDARIARIN
ncbi:hypothetical protein ABZP36_016605 [Zizania latifolia]